MSRPVPLMFVSGPPVYTHVPFNDEESTSMFVKEEESPNLVADPIEVQEVNPSILAQVKKIQSPMGKRIYNRLTFVLEKEEIKGNVLEVDGNTMKIAVDGDEDKVIALELTELQNIIWRGKPLPEN